MRCFVVVVFLACAGAFSLSAVPSRSVAIAASNAEVIMFGGGKKAAPKKVAPKKKAPPKKVVKKVVKKVAVKKAPPKKVVKKTVVAKKRNTEPSSLQKLFSMSMIGGARGVKLGREYYDL